MALLLVLLIAAAGLCTASPLLVLSVDGLDHRYLRDADALGLKIPNLRRLMREGAMADGVVGVVPTVTWPSHTTLITGVTPDVHGILGNRRPKEEGGDYYWSARLLKRKTLLDAARAKGMKTAAITWPVTVDAPVDYNLPELFSKRNGGAMDLESIDKGATPGLVAEITSRFPSFPQAWVNDRVRALATIFFLERKRPELTLVHFVDHDSEAHEHGPFSREAKAVLEYTDELIGDVLRVTPKDYVVAVVSDHGFERTDKVVHIKTHVGSGVSITPFLLVAETAQGADAIRKLRSKQEFGIGREIPAAELHRLAPRYTKAAAAWEPAPHHAFSAADSPDGQLHSVPREKGNHGLWPTRPDYRSVLILWGKGVKAERLPEVQMTDIAGRFARILGLELP